MKGQQIGWVLIGISVLVGGACAVLMSTYYATAELEAGAAVLGVVLAVIVLALPLGFGVFMVWSGRGETAENTARAQKRTLLNMVKTQGQVDVHDAAVAMDVTRADIEKMLYDLVGQGLFSGYVVWDEGMLYSQEAAKLQELDQCPNCGSELTLGGKGVARCEYCGTEFFLAQ